MATKYQYPDFYSLAQLLSKIEDTTLSSASSSIEIKNFPPHYNHLVVFVLARLSTSTNDSLVMRINNDSGSNYDFERVDASGTSPTANEGLGDTFINIGACSGEASSIAQPTILFFPFYSGTNFNKTVHCLGGQKRGTASTNILIRLTIGFWRNSSAINRLTFLPLNGANNLASGTRVNAYVIP